MLPPEISDLVSKTWEQAAVPYLFDEIFISQNLADFRIAQLVMLQFKHYIRTLVFSSIHYKDMDRESFTKEYDEELAIDVETDTETCNSGHAFKLYRIARDDQHQNLSLGSSSVYLSLALTTLPNIQKIVLTDTPSSRSMARQSLQVYYPRESNACPFEQCHLTATDHLPLAVRQSGFSRTGSANPWRLVLFVLSATNAHVKELTMEPRDMQLSTNTAAFSMPPGILGPLKLCFGTLTKIRLSLLEDTERFSTYIDKRHVHQNVGKLLCSAVNLESLSLDTDDESQEWKPPSPTLQEILGRCKFPKLRSLNLAFLVSSEIELLRLLQHSRNLEYFTLGCHHLTEGFWVRIADWIRASLPLLKHAELNQLYGGFEERWKDIEYMDTYGQVGDFFFAQGENPFTTKALEKHQADREAERQMVSCTGGLGHIEAYCKYH